MSNTSCYCGCWICIRQPFYPRHSPTTPCGTVLSFPFLCFEISWRFYISPSRFRAGKHKEIFHYSQPTVIGRTYPQAEHFKSLFWITDNITGDWKLKQEPFRSDTETWCERVTFLIWKCWRFSDTDSNYRIFKLLVVYQVTTRNHWKRIRKCVSRNYRSEDCLDLLVDFLSPSGHTPGH
jgi:hypothetical protein